MGVKHVKKKDLLWITHGLFPINTDRNPQNLVIFFCDVTLNLLDFVKFYNINITHGYLGNLIAI